MAATIPWIFVVCMIIQVSDLSPVTADETATCHQPNVILILADDLALGDLNGGDGRQTRTPNLDRLAQQSVRFSQAYSASCVCAPARAALLTGRYPHRTGVVTLNMNKFPTMTRLRMDETTIAEVFQSAGYATGLIGKWHVGRGKAFHPVSRGFDEFEGFDGSQDLSYFNYSLDINGRLVPADGEYLTDDLSNRAIEFVQRHQDRRFFLHLAHYAPHRPLEAPAEIVKRYSDQGFDESTATIYAMIEVMDRGIGELLEELNDLKLSENTIVVFASDNGPDPLTGERWNNDLRGKKYQVYEGGIRVPLFVRWSGTLKAGDRSQHVHFVDMMPTILDLCNIKWTPPNPIDGESFASTLKDASEKFSSTRFWQWNRGTPNYTHNAAMREGRFKLVRPYVTRGIKLQDSTLSPVLYDLDKDPTESIDIANQHAELTKRMDAQLHQWTESIEGDRLRPLQEEQ